MTVKALGTVRRLKTSSVVQVYRASEIQPTTPTGETIPPTGWSVQPPSGGKIWVSTATAVNNKATSWTVPTRWNGNDGDKGDPGVAGQIVRQSEWMEGAIYHNDGEEITPARYLDVVLVYASNGVVSRYVCKQTHTATTANAPSPSGNAYWMLLSGDFPLYTPLLVAENGDIKFLQSNRILVYKPDGSVDAGLSGNGDGAGGIRFWAGSDTPASAPYRVDANGKLYAFEGEFWGSVKVPFVTLAESDAVDITATDPGLNLYTNKNHRLANKLNVIAEFGTITLPDDISYNGSQANIIIDQPDASTRVDIQLYVKVVNNGTFGNASKIENQIVRQPKHIAYADGLLSLVAKPISSTKVRWFIQTLPHGASINY